MTATGYFFKTSSDVGAPTLDNTAGSLIGVLDWALDVSGATYWEKAYSGTNLAAYRAKNGLRHYLRVDDTQTETAQLKMYETMSDIDTGVGECPDPVNQTATGCRLPKADESGVHKYVVVGDSRFFFFMCDRDNNYPNHWTPMCFGEFPSYDNNDIYNTVLYGVWVSNNDASYSAGDGPNLFTSHFNTLYATTSTAYPRPASPHAMILRNVPGDLRSIFCLAWQPGIPGSTSRVFRYDKARFVPISPTYLVSSETPFGAVPNDVCLYGGSENAFIRGRIPYLYRIPIAPTAGFDDEMEITIDGSTYKGYHYKYSSSAAISRYNGEIIFLRTSDDEPDRP